MVTPKIRFTRCLSTIMITLAILLWGAIGVAAQTPTPIDPSVGLVNQGLEVLKGKTATELALLVSILAMVLSGYLGRLLFTTMQANTKMQAESQDKIILHHTAAISALNRLTDELERRPCVMASAPPQHPLNPLATINFKESVQKTTESSGITAPV